MHFKISLIVFTSFFVGSFCGFSPEVKLTQGILRGKVGESRVGEEYFEFFGIPYGKVNSRFGMSEQADGWGGTREATELSPGCLRVDYVTKEVKGIENCLTLDVYTPVLPSVEGVIKPLPVMFWITGGGFVDGSSDRYNGKYFMEQDVVLVVINYRLGPFGFLNTGVQDARGNQGLKDMVLALKWVQQNIDKFGGDASRVTIFGESAGSTSVSLLTLSPMGQGLFAGAIIQSGTAICPFVDKNIPGLKFAQKLAQAVDCPSSNAQYLVECLQRIQAEKLTSLTATLFDTFGFTANALHFGPTPEATFGAGSDDDNVFLREDPFLLLQRGEFHKVPMIIGMNSHEAIQGALAGFGNATILKKLNHEFGRQLPGIMLYEDSAEDPTLVTEEIRKFYFGGKKEISKEDMWAFEAAVTDRHFTQCTARITEEYSKHTTVYAYNYTKRESMRNMGGGQSQSDLETDMSQTDRPPAHEDELRYLFEFRGSYAKLLPKLDSNGPDVEFSKSLIALWTSFATNRKPGQLWGSSGSEWTPLKSGESQVWLQINETPHMAPLSGDFEIRRMFWDRLPVRQYGKTLDTHY